LDPVEGLGVFGDGVLEPEEVLVVGDGVLDAVGVEVLEIAKFAPKSNVLPPSIFVIRSVADKVLFIPSFNNNTKWSNKT